jgi:hypothetical protein
LNIQAKPNGKLNLKPSYDLTSGDDIIGKLVNSGSGWFVEVEGGGWYHANTIKQAKQLLNELEVLKSEGF